ncbi:MAG: hypothetical protein ABRQ25_02230 [Clostridiaceae bacterium]
MPEVFPNNKLWRRGGHLNQKRHIDMTEEEKTNVAKCTGIKASHVCKNPVFRCSECGNYGCDQEVADKCTAQAFKNDKCLQCGSVGTRIPVMKDELDKFIAEWEKEVAEVEK